MIINKKSFARDELLFWPETSEYGTIDETSNYTGVFSYGNGFSLNRGTYHVRVSYEEDAYNRYEVLCRVNNEEQIITKGSLPPDANQYDIVFSLPSHIRNKSVEIRTYYNGIGRFKIEEITVTREMPVMQTGQFGQSGYFLWNLLDREFSFGSSFLCIVFLYYGYGNQ